MKWKGYHYGACLSLLVLVVVGLLSLGQSQAELILVGIAKARSGTASARERAELEAEMRAARLLQLASGVEFEVATLDGEAARVRAVNGTTSAGWSFRDRQFIGQYAQVRATPPTATPDSSGFSSKRKRLISLQGPGDEAVALLDRAILDAGRELLQKARTNHLTIDVRLVECHFAKEGAPPAFKATLVLTRLQ